MQDEELDVKFTRPELAMLLYGLRNTCEVCPMRVPTIIYPDGCNRCGVPDLKSRLIDLVTSPERPKSV